MAKPRHHSVASLVINISLIFLMSLPVFAQNEGRRLRKKDVIAHSDVLAGVPTCASLFPKGEFPKNPMPGFCSTVDGNKILIEEARELHKKGLLGKGSTTREVKGRPVTGEISGNPFPQGSRGRKAPVANSNSAVAPAPPSEPTSAEPGSEPGAAPATDATVSANANTPTANTPKDKTSEPSKPGSKPKDDKSAKEEKPAKDDKAAKEDPQSKEDPKPIAKNPSGSNENPKPAPAPQSEVDRKPGLDPSSDPKISIPQPTKEDDEALADKERAEIEKDSGKASPQTPGQKPGTSGTSGVSTPGSTAPTGGDNPQTQKGQSAKQKGQKGVDKAGDEPVTPPLPKNGRNNNQQQIANGTQTGKKDEIAASSANSCEDEALKAIQQFLLKDDSNALGHMFELASLRLAHRAADGVKTTIEEKIKSDIEDGKVKLAEADADSSKQEEIRKIYEAYGKASDIKAVQADLDSFLKKGKDACYWCKNSRLLNDHASAYILAVSIGEGAEASGLSEIDAATVWAVEKIRSQAAKANVQYRFGQELGNLMNVSVRAARYLGRIAGGVALSPAEIQAEIDKRMKDLAEVFAQATKSVEESLLQCLKERHKGCDDCVTKSMDAFKADTSKLEDLQKSLLKSVTQEANTAKIKALKGKIGEVTFDLSDFAKGTVPRDTRKGGKLDACGHHRGSHQKKK